MAQERLEYLTFFILVGIILITIAQVVFGTIGLSYSVPILQNSELLKEITNCSNIASEQIEGFEQGKSYHMYWLIVFGSLSWFLLALFPCFLTCIKFGNDMRDQTTNQDDTEYYCYLSKNKVREHEVVIFIRFLLFCWVLYGLFIVSDEKYMNILTICDKQGAYLLSITSIMGLVFSCIYFGMLIVGFMISCGYFITELIR